MSNRGQERAANHRHVIERWVRTRHRIEAAFPVVVGLDPVVALAVLKNEQILRGPAPAKRPVEAIILGPVRNAVQAIRGAAEELDAIVLAFMRLNVLDHGAGTDSVEPECVRLRLRIEVHAGELDAHVPQHAARVFVIRAAVNWACLGHYAFGYGVVTRYIGIAQDNQATPAAGRTGANIVVAGHHDRSLATALGHDFPALLDHDNGILALGEDQRAWLDRQRRPVIDEHLVPDLVDRIVVPGGVRRNLCVRAIFSHDDRGVLRNDEFRVGPLDHLSGVHSTSFGDEVPEPRHWYVSGPDLGFRQRRQRSGVELARQQSECVHHRFGR